jgi:hypothetical protein
MKLIKHKKHDKYAIKCKNTFGFIPTYLVYDHYGEYGLSFWPGWMDKNTAKRVMERYKSWE